MSSKKVLVSSIALSCLLAFSFCKKEAGKVTHLSDSAEVPELPEKVDDYPASKNDYLAALGRVLFYDKELSANKNVSCGTCHQQQHAFADGKQFSSGTFNEHTKRNTPQVFSRTGLLFWDGRASAMEDLMLMPVKDQREMSINNMTMLIERIRSIDYYKHLFAHAYPSSLDIDSSKIKTALAEFVKNFSFTNNKLNQSLKGQAKLTPVEETGKNLFFGEAGCNNCHALTPAAGTNAYYNSFDQSHNIGLDRTNPDPGVGAITRNKNDEGAFITPVLFNVEYTAPYMHDGRFNTLEEVVEHYNSEVQDNPNLDPFLKVGSHPKKLNLDENEKTALVAFLKTLSDPAVLTDQRYSDPFVPRGK
jgi:cytochrome c peroxidase